MAHARIRDVFKRFGDSIAGYHGHVRELLGDALLAEFERASDAVCATLAFQARQAEHNARLNDEILPSLRVGIALGEVIIADNTITGSGVVLAQRLEQLAPAGGLCVTPAIREALPKRLPFELENLGEQNLKGFDEAVGVYRVALRAGAQMPAADPGTPGLSRRGSTRILVALVISPPPTKNNLTAWKHRNPRPMTCFCEASSSTTGSMPRRWSKRATYLARQRR